MSIKIDTLFEDRAFVRQTLRELHFQLLHNFKARANPHIFLTNPQNQQAIAVIVMAQDETEKFINQCPSESDLSLSPVNQNTFPIPSASVSSGSVPGGQFNKPFSIRL
jgi:hypothetical protein